MENIRLPACLDRGPGEGQGGEIVFPVLHVGSVGGGVGGGVRQHHQGEILSRDRAPGGASVRSLHSALGVDVLALSVLQSDQLAEVGVAAALKDSRADSRAVGQGIGVSIRVQRQDIVDRVLENDLEPEHVLAGDEGEPLAQGERNRPAVRGQEGSPELHGPVIDAAIVHEFAKQGGVRSAQGQGEGLSLPAARVYQLDDAVAVRVPGKPEGNELSAAVGERGLHDVRLDVVGSFRGRGLEIPPDHAQRRCESGGRGPSRHLRGGSFGGLRGRGLDGRRLGRGRGLSGPELLLYPGSPRHHDDGEDDRQDRLRIECLVCLVFVHGTGSKPPGFKGWQRRMRRTASPVPFRGPCFRTASSAYSEQVG